MIARVESERGLTNMVVLALVLPVLVLFFTAMLDTARMPLTRQRMLDALKNGAYAPERALADARSPLVIDGFTPAGNNLCAAMKTVGVSCDTEMTTVSGRQGFFTPGVAQAFAEKSCQIAAQRIEQSADGIFALEFGDPVVKPYAVQFAVVRFRANPGTGQMAALPDVVGISNDGCSGSSFAALIGNSGVSAASVANKLVLAFKQQGIGAGAWKIEGADSNPWLSSYWFVGVMHYRMAKLMDFSGDDNSHLVEYFVRPLETVAGIQAPGV